MQTPLRITFRHMARSAALEEHVRTHLARLERRHEQVTGCDVVITGPSEHRQQGAPFDVRVNLTMRERALHAHNGDVNRAHADAYLAVRDTFEVLERMIRRYLHALHRHRERGSIRHDAQAARVQPQRE